MSTAAFLRKPHLTARRPAAEPTGGAGGAPRPSHPPVQFAPAPRLSAPLSGAVTPVQLKTEIVHKKGTYDWEDEDGMNYSETVGMDMTAKLDPADPKNGSEPGDGVQADLMGYLKGEYGGRHFVRGHLLNGNLGGLGIAENLYPITYQANSEHKNEVENHVKDQLHLGKKLTYRVKVDRPDDDLPDATFKCTLWAAGDSQPIMQKDIASKPGKPRGDRAEIEVHYPTDDEDPLWDSISVNSSNLPKGWGQTGKGLGSYKYNHSGTAVLNPKDKVHATIK